MDKKPLISISICAVVLLVLSSLTNVAGSQTAQSSNKTTITNEVNRGFKQDVVINWIFKGMVGNNYWHNHSVTITFSNGSWVHIFVNIDGGGWFEYIEPIVVETEGRHTVMWYWVDEWGAQWDMQPLIFGIDMTPPVVTMNVDGNWFQDWWRVIVGIVDPLSGIDHLELYFNGLLMVSEYLSGHPTYTWFYELTSHPNNVIKVFVSDMAGNKVNFSSNVSSIYTQNQQSHQQMNHLFHFLNYIQIMTHQRRGNLFRVL